jgi:ABC-type multidrug transport system ATPase subunit
VIDAQHRSRIVTEPDLVGIADTADRAIHTLSGGETQRLGLAQAQIHQPELHGLSIASLV